MLTFVYFWRLTYDKGIDIILDSFAALWQAGIEWWELQIYGDGPYKPQCILANLQDNHITFHGRKPQSTIHNTLSTAHYCLAPSRVLETFGKSALEALQFWLPVIGFQKWWLWQFITDRYALDIDKPLTSLISMLTDIITDHNMNGTVPDRDESITLAWHYSKESWLEIVDSILIYPYTTEEEIEAPLTTDQENHTALETARLLASKKERYRILYISDFVREIGGIETFLHESRALLQTHNYRVALTGSSANLSFFGLIYTACNIPGRFQTRRVAQKLKPNTIRYHSLFRRLGRTAILPKWAAKHHIMTIHDLWYFHPYPSKISNDHSVPPFTLDARLIFGKTVPQKILITAKFLSLSLLKHKLIHTIDTRCVPSAFMIDILHNSRHIPREKIVVLPHFTS